MKIWCFYCNKEEELENSCFIKLKKIEEEINLFWKEIDVLNKERKFRVEEAWKEFWEKLDWRTLVFGLDWAKKKYLYPKLDKIEEWYEKERKKKDWKKLRNLQLQRENIMIKSLKRWLK